MPFSVLRRKWRRREALNWLTGIAETAENRIDAGDMDFDDVVYRSRDAAVTLLEIWGE